MAMPCAIAWGYGQINRVQRDPAAQAREFVDADEWLSGGPEWRV